uniref:Ionotropic glutamate receptor C-terminal domain-containing protein n=1 Tax=Megaselia scalaris TaxID=36166 RepID=T1GCL9_MEGSC
MFGIGRIYKLVNNFIQFINGSVQYILEIDNGASYELLKYFDFWTKIVSTTLADDLKLFPLNCEITSNILEKYNLLVIVPKAEYIDSSQYIAKPVSLSLWVLCLVYLIYGSTLLSATFFIIKRDLSTWRTFNQLLRSLMSQSYTSPLPGLQMTTVYLLAMSLEFIMTIFYSTFLGSFLTTYIREPQISILEELKRANMKIMNNGNYLTSAFGYNNIEDVLIEVSFGDREKALLSKNSSYGQIIHSTIWDLSMLAQDYVHLKILF